MFGKNIKFDIQDKEVETVLIDKLSIYPVGKEENFEVKISILDKIQFPKKYYNNPSIHYTTQNSFIINFGVIKVKYTKDDLLYIDIEIDKSKNFISKFRTINYENTIDSIGEILHELVFIPMNFFDTTKALIHASSMKNISNNKVIMIGGTGGVGKTSLELLLCEELGYSFISDDIAIVSSDIKIFPNLSYPKIYAYNVANNIKLYNKLFMNKSIIDKFQWNLRKKLKGEKGVRRSISPNIIFDSVERVPNKIDEYYILSRTNLVTKIEIEEVDNSIAVDMTLKIIKNEYASVIQHIVWHEYNALFNKQNPIISELKLYETWSNIYQKIFSNIKCFVVRIPNNISHEIFLKSMKKVFHEK